jgi:cysteine desulfurase
MKYPVYLDCNATTPIETSVLEVMHQFLVDDFGNEGSRTHEYGNRAKQAVQRARDQVGQIVGAQRDEVVFTSGATEANNLAILGLAEHGLRQARKHIISTQIEHKAVLEPLEELERKGFDVELLAPTIGGWVDPEKIKKSLRPETLLVSVMHANNETGVIQDIDAIADALRGHEAYLHVDAAQTFGKIVEPLLNKRIDFISASGHKIFAPKGIGALIIRRREYSSPPLKPLAFGGGQERGLRPGTLPVHLIVGFGKAAELASQNKDKREEVCLQFRKKFLLEINSLDPVFQGDPQKTLPHTVNVSFRGVNSEAAMVALKNLVAVSNGSACTSAYYKPSHVLKAMGLADEQIMGAIRFSWCHLTPAPDWEKIREALASLK